MRTKYLILIIALLFFYGRSEAQVKTTPTINDTIKLSDVIIDALRSNTPLKEMPAAISVVKEDQINKMTKTIAADEILRLVPG